MQEFEIIFYDLKDGTEPVKDYILSLDKKMKSKVLKTLSMLQINGNELREPYTAPIGDGIFELRVKCSSNISRILFFFMMNNKIVLTNGFTKKTRKTPKKEIYLSKKYRDDFLGRERE